MVEDPAERGERGRFGQRHHGVGGQGPVDQQRARKAVRRRTADALNRIEDAHPALGRHLRHSVHTGIYCSYTPEHDIRWDTGRPRP